MDHPKCTHAFILMAVTQQKNAFKMLKSAETRPSKNENRHEHTIYQSDRQYAYPLHEGTGNMG